MQTQSVRRHPLSWVVILLFLILFFSACASAGSGGMSNYNPDRISSEELAQAREEGVRNLDELIRSSRPGWLRTDRIQSFNVGTTILIFDGDSLLGDVEILQELPLNQISEIRWLDPAQAAALPGAGGDHVQGAIVVIRS